MKVTLSLDAQRRAKLNILSTSNECRIMQEIETCTSTRRLWIVAVVLAVWLAAVTAAVVAAL